MHLQLYDVGMCGIELLDDWSCKNDPRMQRALRRWPTVFTNVSVIANQCTPLHPSTTTLIPDLAGMMSLSMSETLTIVFWIFPHLE